MIHRLIWPVGSNRLPANRLSAWAVGLSEEFVATYQEGTAEVRGINLLARMEKDEFDLIAVGRRSWRIPTGRN